MPTEQATSAPPVLRLVDSNKAEVAGLLARFGLSLVCCVGHHIIPGSYWGDDEAGLKGNSLYARGDTPLHSILHEACHYICVSDERRQRLDTNAGSDEARKTRYVTCRFYSPNNSPTWAARASSPTWMPGVTVSDWVRASAGSNLTPRMPWRG